MNGRRDGPRAVALPLLLPPSSSAAGEHLQPAAVVGGAPSLVKAQNKSPQEGDGTRCRDLPFTAIRATNADGQHAALTCKRWRCDDCGRTLKRRLRKAFLGAIEQNPDLRRFFTLTLNGAARNLPLPERYAELSRAFSKFRRRMSRAQGRAFPYALVREPHKDGTPHVHGLTDRFVPFRELAATWAACGGGYVDIRYVDPQRAGAYLTKYLSKDGRPPPKGHRKYAAGGGIKLEGIRPKGAGGWWVEVMGTRLDGSAGWVVADPAGPHIARLALHRWLDDTGPPLREAIAARVAATERDAAQRRLVEPLEALADGLAPCVVCGSTDHDVHRAA